MSVNQDPAQITVATIGGPETFAGEATTRLRQKYPVLSQPIYFDTGDALFDALTGGKVDAIVAASANLVGYTILESMLAAPDSGLYVIAECQLPFECLLLAKRGTRLSDIGLVYGGPVSIGQASAFISECLPNVETARYTNPLATAQGIAEGDGKAAILGTRGMAERFELNVVANNVDGGAVNGNWWALSSKPVFAQDPDCIFVAGRLSGDGGLGRLVAAVSATGYTLANVFTAATGRKLLEFDYVLGFHGTGTLAEVESQLAAAPPARLAGAIRAR